MAEAGPPWLSAHHSALAGGDRATLGGWGGVASVCCGVVRLCGFERALFCADAPANVNAGHTAAGSPPPLGPRPVRRLWQRLRNLPRRADRRIRLSFRL